VTRVEPVAGLLLAAGGGRRVGAPKALLRLDGRLLVERAVGVLREAGCAPIVVVLGAGADRVRAEADLGDATVVVNDAWGSGLGSSLRAGLDALDDTQTDATVVMLVDTPGVTAEAVRRVAALPYRQALVCATYGGRRGHPMLFGRAHWPGIATLAKVDVGARPYLVARAGEVLDVACDGVASDDDIDTPEAAAAWDIPVPQMSASSPGSPPTPPVEPSSQSSSIEPPSPPGPAPAGSSASGPAPVGSAPVGSAPAGSSASGRASVRSPVVPQGRALGPPFAPPFARPGPERTRPPAPPPLASVPAPFAPPGAERTGPPAPAPVAPSS
jgi:molybdenum cofactor cytidylyltransferase/nicotine blue oxidoreductase